MERPNYHPNWVTRIVRRTGPAPAVVRRTRLRQVVPYLVSWQGLVCLRSFVLFNSFNDTEDWAARSVSSRRSTVYGSLQKPGAVEGGRKSDIAAAAADQQSQQDEAQLPCRLHAESDEVNLPKGSVAYSSHCRGRSLHPQTTHRSGLRVKPG